MRPEPKRARQDNTLACASSFPGLDLQMAAPEHRQTSTSPPTMKHDENHDHDYDGDDAGNDADHHVDETRHDTHNAHAMMRLRTMRTLIMISADTDAHVAKAHQGMEFRNSPVKYGNLAWRAFHITI